MELQRRYGAGRLAEIFGTEALATDRQMRVLGLYRAAEAEIPFLSPEVRRGLEAYAAGVNAFLGVAPWRLAARISAAALCPRAMAAGRQSRLGQADGIAARRQLPRRIAARPHGPHDLGGGPRRFSIPNTRKTPRRRWRTCCRSIAGCRSTRSTRAAAGRRAASTPRTTGSSTARHSASGKPLLANDPHLAFGAPGFWYLARLKTPAARDRRRDRRRQSRLSWSAITTGSPGALRRPPPMSRISLSRSSIPPIPAAI